MNAAASAMKREGRQHDARELHGQRELAGIGRELLGGEAPDERLGEDDAEQHEHAGHDDAAR